MRIGDRHLRPAAPRPAARRLKIAVVGARGLPSTYSGIERIWASLYPRLADAGHDVTIYCRPGVTGGGDRFGGCRLVETPAPGPIAAQTLSHTWTALRHAARSGPADVVALHALPPQVFVRQARRAGSVVVSHVHGLDWDRAKWRQTPLRVGSRLIRLGERRMVRHADVVAVCNRDLVDYYRREYGLHAEFLPNGVEPGEARPVDFDPQVLRDLGLLPGRYVVGVGRVVPEKRVHDSAAATALLPGTKFVVVGEGTDRRYVSAVRSAGPHVVMAGHRRGAELETLVRAAGAYVTSSELEGLPSSVLEAMIRGVPVVASDIPPHRELLAGADGFDGFFPVGDVRTAADRLARVLSPDVGPQVGRRLQAHSLARFAWPVLAERFEAVYLDAVARRAAARG